MIEPDTDTWIMIRKDHINGVLPEARYKSGLFKWQSLSVPVYTLSAFLLLTTPIPPNRGTIRVNNLLI